MTDDVRMAEPFRIGQRVMARDGMCAPAGAIGTVVGDDALDDTRVLVDVGVYGREWCEWDDIELFTEHDDG